MWITIGLILLYLLIPVFLIYLTKISSFLKQVGAVVLAYVVGLLFGNTGIIPSPGEKLESLLAGKRTFLPRDEFIEFMNSPGFIETDAVYNQIAQIQQSIMNYTILLAIPLLLLSLNLRKWLKEAHHAIL